MTWILGIKGRKDRTFYDIEREFQWRPLFSSNDKSPVFFCPFARLEIPGFPIVCKSRDIRCIARSYIDARRRLRKLVEEYADEKGIYSSTNLGRVAFIRAFVRFVRSYQALCINFGRCVFHSASLYLFSSLLSLLPFFRSASCLPFVLLSRSLSFSPLSFLAVAQGENRGRPIE